MASGCMTEWLVFVCSPSGCMTELAVYGFFRNFFPIFIQYFSLKFSHVRLRYLCDFLQFFAIFPSFCAFLRFFANLCEFFQFLRFFHFAKGLKNRTLKKSRMIIMQNPPGFRIIFSIVLYSIV